MISCTAVSIPTFTYFSCRHTHHTYSNIYLLFLPPYASHVFQPFDLSVFGPIKVHYCTAIRNLIYQLNDCLINKRSFLECYSKVRQYGLNEKNILAGWKATGLWPINHTKPLISRLVLDTVKPQLIELQQFNQVQIELDQT